MNMNTTIQLLKNIFLAKIIFELFFFNSVPVGWVALIGGIYMQLGGSAGR